ncbi:MULTISPECIES: aldehyde dehydrogenase family protein [unclassified Nocardia]|uniref:aldehyde dehydrogenase family protein n=1 Tax=unclassified Nocardia TaxID=2637762 RepID=UPI00339E8954
MCATEKYGHDRTALPAIPRFVPGPKRHLIGGEWVDAASTRPPRGPRWTSSPTAARFDDLDEALAGDTPYGLAGGVWTRDLSTARTVARGIDAGTIWSISISADEAAAGRPGVRSANTLRRGSPTR